MFQVYFAAINCWQPHSECRQQFSRVQQFPVLIVYTQENKGIQYKGIREADHMIRFLQYVLHPLERITRPADVLRLMSVYDVSTYICSLSKKKERVFSILQYTDIPQFILWNFMSLCFELWYTFIANTNLWTQLVKIRDIRSHSVASSYISINIHHIALCFNKSFTS